MKQLLFPLFCAIAISSAHAQDFSFSKTYDRTDGDEARPITSSVTLDLGLITISNTLDFGADGGVILRTNPDGSVMWEKKYYGASPAIGLYFNDVIATYDSSYIVSGQILDVPSDNYYPFCMKLNDQGDTLWMKRFDFSSQIVGDYGTFLEFNTHLTESMDSSILMTWQHSSFEDFPSNPDHLCIVKLASNGDLVWSNSMIVESTFFARDIAEANDQSIYILGNTDNTFGIGYCVHLTDVGLFDWAKKYDGVEFREIILDSTGFAVSWLDIQNQASGIMKFDSAGVNTKRVRCNGGTWDLEPSFTRRSNGNFLLSQRGDNFGGGHFYEMNDSLTSIISFMPYMIVQTIRSIPNYGVYAVGYGPLYGVKSDYNQIGISRLDSLMNTSTSTWCVYQGTAVMPDYSLITPQNVLFTDAESIIGLEDSVHLELTSSVVVDGCVTFYGSVNEMEGTWNETIFPNPSAGEFTVSWGEYREVELMIYNSIGKEVYRGKTKDAFVEIDLRTEQNGLYYYRLMDEAGSQSNGKLSLMK